MRCQSLHPSHHAPEEIKTGARAWTGLQRATHGAQEPTHDRHRVAPMHHKQIVSPHTPPPHPKTRSRHRCTGCVATAAGLQPQAPFFPSLPIPTLSHYHPSPRGNDGTFRNGAVTNSALEAGSRPRSDGTCAVWVQNARPACCPQPPPRGTKRAFLAASARPCARVRKSMHAQNDQNKSK